MSSELGHYRPPSGDWQRWFEFERVFPFSATTETYRFSLLDQYDVTIRRDGLLTCTRPFAREDYIVSLDLQEQKRIIKAHRSFSGALADQPVAILIPEPDKIIVKFDALHRAELNRAGEITTTLGEAFLPQEVPQRKMNPRGLTTNEVHNGILSYTARLLSIAAHKTIKDFEKPELPAQV